jgi:hypothetical protein
MEFQSPLIRWNGIGSQRCVIKSLSVIANEAGDRPIFPGRVVRSEEDGVGVSY